VKKTIDRAVIKVRKVTAITRDDVKAKTKIADDAP
jgi:hypothetical protein